MISRTSILDIVTIATRLYDPADISVRLERVIEPAVCVNVEHPFQEILANAPKDPARYAEVTSNTVRRGPCSDHRSAVVVIPLTKVSLRGAARIDWMVDDCAWNIHDLLTRAEKPGCEFGVFAGYAAVLPANA